MKKAVGLLTRLIVVLAALSCATQAASQWTGTWIWNDTPVEDAWFRKTIDVGENVASAKLAITADNIYSLYVNGSEVGSDSDWTGIEVYDIASYLKPGRNVIAVKATDPGAGIGALLVEGAVTYEDGTALLIGTDGTWKISLTQTPGWTSIDLDDSGWKTPREIGKPPIGPWGGIEHPSITPKVPMETVSVFWPKQCKPGDTLKVVCKVRPGRRIPVDSPVCLRLLSHGQTVCEQWIEPDSPITSWQPGKVRAITFPRFYLPVYVPRGRLQAQVVTNATAGKAFHAIWVGPRPVSAAPKPHVILYDLKTDAAQSGGVVEIRLSAKVKNGERGGSFLFTLMQGDEMWYAATIASAENTRVTLPKGFPGGTYTARLVPHRTVSRAAAACTVEIPGPAQTTLRPLGYGRYTDRNGVRHSWYVSQHGALIWDGKPYVPVGGMYLSRFFMDFAVATVDHNEEMFREDIARLKQIKAAGVTDLYLNPCRQWNERPAWVWQRFADLCEEAGINYGLQVTNHVQPLKGYHIAQDEYVVRIKPGEIARAEITGTYVGRPDPTSTVLYAAFDPSAGDLAEFGKADLKPARTGVIAEALPKAGASRELIVHFIPEYTFSGDMHDYWQAVNADYKAELDSLFGAMDLGPNFRLWIDPLDNEQSFRDLNRLLPHSAQFRAMFAERLKAKYRTVASCAAAWGLSGAEGITDFVELARLVPLGRPNPDSDTGYALDDVSHRTYRVNLAKSAMWFDMLRFRDSSIAEFNNRVADMIKKHHDVPVVLKATDTDCFTNLRTHGGFDGVGMEAYGSAPELVRGCGGGVYSRCKMANRTMWTLVTETGLASPDVPVGYPDPVRMTKELGSMAEMNAKGTFCFLFSNAGGKPGEGWYALNITEDPRQFYWMGAFSRMMKRSAELPDYEPEVDYYWPGSIAGQHNGFARARPAFGADIPSQSVAGDSGRWVVPASTRIPTDARRLIVNIEDSPATEIHKDAFESALKDREVAVIGQRRNLGALSIDSYYTTSFVRDSDGSVVQVLAPTPTSKIFARTPDGVVYGLTDGNLTLYSKRDWLSAVRKMAGPAQQTSFYQDILGLQVLDLGKAFQGMRFGPYTYLWNLTGDDHALTLDLPAGAGQVCITEASGTRSAARPGAAIRLTLPARAANPVVVENLPDGISIEGIDKANLLAATREWADAQERAKRLGVEATVMPPSSDWRRIYELAGDLQKLCDEAQRTTTAARISGVKADGDLSEWASVKPVFLKVDVGRDFSTIEDYRGAKFYLGYDESFLYIAGDIKDEAVVNNYRLDNLWNGDAVEVFIDLKPDVNPLSHNYTSDCFQFIFAPTSVDAKPAVVVKSPGLPAGHVPPNTVLAVSKTESGWQFEAAISRTDINGVDLKPGTMLGFNIHLGDSDGGDRVSSKLWRGDKDASRNRLSLGRLVLGE